MNYINTHYLERDLAHEADMREVLKQQLSDDCGTEEPVDDGGYLDEGYDDDFYLDDQDPYADSHSDFHRQNPV